MGSEISVRLAAWNSRLRWLGLAAVVGLVLLICVFPPDGSERSQTAQFVGRFHLLTVHFPIALILLVPVLELAGRDGRLGHLRAAVDFVLMLAVISSVVTALLGWCLARSSGYQGRLVTQHMWGGVAIAAASWGCWMLRSRVIGERLGGAYVAALIGTVALVFWAGYRGGQIAEGENHMTEKLPQAVRGMFVPRNQSAGATTPDAESVYGAQVAPVLAANCTSCHGAEKHKGNLRLDSYEAILRGGRDGPVVRAGDVKDSEIVRRITMLPGEDGAMPPEGKPRLSAAEIELIKAWIAGGASKSAAMPGTAVGRTK